MRYDKRQVFRNDRSEYKDLLKSRSQRYFLQHETAILRHPTVEEIVKLNISSEIWKVGDRLYKYAYKYYQDSELWWVIAWYNQRPTEAHFIIGDVVEIPQPLNDVLRYFGL